MIKGETFEFEMDGLIHTAKIESISFERFGKKTKILEIEIINSRDEDE